MHLTADLHNCRVCEGLIEDVHVAAQFQCINNEIFCSGGNLHQTCQAKEAPVGVVLKTGERNVSQESLQKQHYKTNSIPNEGRKSNKDFFEKKTIG